MEPGSYPKGMRRDTLGLPYIKRRKRRTLPVKESKGTKATLGGHISSRDRLTPSYILVHTFYTGLNSCFSRTGPTQNLRNPSDPSGRVIRLTLLLDFKPFLRNGYRVPLFKIYLQYL